MCYICNICHICNIHTICDIINVCNICNGYNMQYKQYTKDIALQLFAWCVQYQSKLKLKYIPPTPGPKGPKKPNKLHIPPQMIITISMWTSTDTPPPSVGMIYTISILTETDTHPPYPGPKETQQITPLLVAQYIQYKCKHQLIYILPNCWQDISNTNVNN